jgi:hypothetical protein
MKKVIFISALAIAAAVSCTKSDIVDTKFNEQISCEAYAGRDAKTKADVIERNDLESVVVFGYYHGLKDWATGKSLLWTDGLTLDTKNNTVAQPDGSNARYWANETDKYSFLAYAPVTGLDRSANFDINDPVLTYTVTPATFANGDVLVAVPHINRTRKTLNGETVEDGTVALQFKHKLARLAIKATATSEAFDFRIKEVTVNGKFYTSADISLSNPAEWKPVATTTATPFSFFEYDEDNAVALDETKENVIGTKGYMMMIPVSAEQHAATLTVKYTTYDSVAGQESSIYTQTYNITQNFEMGTAYAINLKFENEAKKIVFDVTVDPWNTKEVEVQKNEVTNN